MGKLGLCGLILGALLASGCDKTKTISGNVTYVGRCETTEKRSNHQYCYYTCRNFSMESKDGTAYSVDACNSFITGLNNRHELDEVLIRRCLDIDVGDEVAVTGKADGIYIKTRFPIASIKKKSE
jgi:hypothetical protein